MLEILQHPELDVQTEEQMLTFVSGYVARHALDDDVVRSLYGHVRLAFLSNNRLAALLQVRPGRLGGGLCVACA